MPPQHRWYAEWSPERFVRWGRALGANVEAVIEQVLKDAKYPPRGFRSCLGILSLEKSYGAVRLDRACRRGAVLPTVLLPPHSEHAEAGPGGGARAAAAELPQS